MVFKLCKWWTKSRVTTEIKMGPSKAKGMSTLLRVPAWWARGQKESRWAVAQMGRSLRYYTCHATWKQTCPGALSDYVEFGQLLPYTAVLLYLVVSFLRNKQTVRRDWALFVGLLSCGSKNWDIPAKPWEEFPSLLFSLDAENRQFSSFASNSLTPTGCKL